MGDLNEPGVVVNETSTSRHDATRIGEIFHLFRSNFKKKFACSLKFRIVGMDLSWATIHAALEVLNMETIDEYAVRIYKYSKLETSEFTKSFLASCCSHTMHRFTRALKRQVKFFDKEHRTFAVLCFSLLLNSTDLESSKQIFKLICNVFMHDKYSSEVDVSK